MMTPAEQLDASHGPRQVCKHCRDAIWWDPLGIGMWKTVRDGICPVGTTITITGGQPMHEPDLPDMRSPGDVLTWIDS